MKICEVKNFDTLISLRDYINSNRIQKEDIVQIFDNDGQYALIFYKAKTYIHEQQ